MKIQCRIAQQLQQKLQRGPYGPKDKGLWRPERRILMSSVLWWIGIMALLAFFGAYLVKKRNYSTWLTWTIALVLVSSAYYTFPREGFLKLWNHTFWKDPGFGTLWGNALWFGGFVKWILAIFVCYVLLAVFFQLGKYFLSKASPTERKSPENRASLTDRLKANGFKISPIHWVDPFYCNAKSRAGRYVSVVRPGEIAEFDDHLTITRWIKRTEFTGQHVFSQLVPLPVVTLLLGLSVIIGFGWYSFISFLLLLLGVIGSLVIAYLFPRVFPGWYMKWPLIEKIDVVFTGTQQIRFNSRPINTGGFKEPPVKPVSTLLEEAVEISTGKEFATANGPQITMPFFIWFEIYQVLWYLRLGEETRKNLRGELIEPTVNSLLQDTLPDLLMSDVQRCPAQIFLLGTPSEIKAIRDGVAVRDAAAATYWRELMLDQTKPFYGIDFENFDSRKSREVIARLTTEEVPYGDRERRRCVLVQLTQAGIRLLRFGREEAEPEDDVREAITRKGVAQIDQETRVITERGNYAAELIKQNARVASAVGDAQKVEKICEICSLPASYKPYLVAFFQEQRTREAIAEKSKGGASMFVLGDDFMAKLGSYIQGLDKVLRPTSIINP